MQEIKFSHVFPKAIKDISNYELKKSKQQQQRYASKKIHRKLLCKTLRKFKKSITHLSLSSVDWPSSGTLVALFALFSFAPSLTALLVDTTFKALAPPS